MNNMSCIYPDRESVIVAYLYDDVDAAERVAFETHVNTCLPRRGDRPCHQPCEPLVRQAALSGAGFWPGAFKLIKFHGLSCFHQRGSASQSQM